MDGVDEDIKGYLKTFETDKTHFPAITVMSFDPLYHSQDIFSKYFENQYSALSKMMVLGSGSDKAFDYLRKNLKGRFSRRMSPFKKKGMMETLAGLAYLLESRELRLKLYERYSLDMLDMVVIGIIYRSLGITKENLQKELEEFSTAYPNKNYKKSKEALRKSLMKLEKSCLIEDIKSKKVLKGLRTVKTKGGNVGKRQKNYSLVEWLNNDLDELNMLLERASELHEERISEIRR